MAGMNLQENPSISIDDEVTLVADVALNLKDGFWECDTCSPKRWCDHIEKLTKGNLDHGLVWELILKGETFGMEVPMLPSSGVFTAVVIDPIVSSNNKVYSAMMSLPNLPVGLLSEGDGTGIMRAMIFNWFEGSLFPGMVADKTICKWSSHTIKAQRDWSMSLVTANGMLAQQYCLWTVKKCLYCARANAEDKSWDEFIPESSPTRWK